MNTNPAVLFHFRFTQTSIFLTVISDWIQLYSPDANIVMCTFTTSPTAVSAGV